MSVRVPKYRLHKPTGQALVEIRGQRIYLGKHGSPASHEKYRRLIAELMSGQPVPPPAADAAPLLTIDRLVLQYYRHCQRYYVKEGVATDEVAAVRAALRRLRGLYGGTPAEAFGPKAFKLLRESLCQEGLSRKYVNDSMARIRRMFRWAVADMVRLQRITGMRPAEVCQLRPGEIDRTGEVWLYRPRSHKTQHCGRERNVPLGPRAQAIVLRYLARDAADYCFRPCDSEGTLTVR